MKTNAIIRIILYAVIILVLLAVLFAGLGFTLYTADIRTESHSTIAEGPLAADGEILRGTAGASGIQRIQIEWVAGDITIQTSEDAKDITFFETGNDLEKYQMVYTIQDEKLEIQYCKDSISFPSFGFNIDVASKDLIIIVPADWHCEELELDVAAANVLVQDMNIREVDFDGASGTCTFENCTVDQMELDTASGDVEFSGQLHSLDFDTASASFTGLFSNVPSVIKMDSASGKLELTLPADAGFTASIEGLSCDFTSQFPTTTVNGAYVCGSGACRIQVDGMSCDVAIRKGS